MFLCDFGNHLTKTAGIAENRLKHMIIIKTKFLRCRGIRRFSGDQYGNNGQVPTGLMEVFQIERIIPNLLGILPVIDLRSDLEFQRKNNTLKQKNHINTLPQSWNGIFKENLSIGLVLQNLFEHLNLKLPRIALQIHEIKRIFRRQSPENFILGTPDKIRYAICVEISIHWYSSLFVHDSAVLRVVGSFPEVFAGIRATFRRPAAPACTTLRTNSVRQAVLFSIISFT